MLKLFYKVCLLALVPFTLLFAHITLASQASEPASHDVSAQPADPLLSQRPVSQQQAFLPLTETQYPETIVNLGKQLFFDKILSGNHDLSCAGCHSPDHGFADPRAFSPNTQGGALTLNTPGLAYSALLLYQNWAGQVPSLETQLALVVANPKVMNLPWPELVKRLKKHPDYPALFKQAGYPTITQETITNAIVTYEKSLAVPSRFDAFLRGDRQQLNQQEQEGFRKFKDFGCISCHQGIALGGNLRQKFGVMRDYLSMTDTIQERDQGYFNFTHQPQDKFYFRVPTLRDVALTPPYFHDASAQTLEQAIKIMFRHQLAIEAKPSDIHDIAAFLKSLNGIHHEPQ